MYKCRLQEICQQKRWALPTYVAMKDGPDHLPRFKGTVTVNGLSFNSTESCSTSREAHNDAAKHAFLHFAPPSPQPDSSVSVAESNAEGPNVGETNLGPESLCGTFTAVDDMQYKNQLLIYAQLKNLDMPQYSNQSEGLPHERRFKATVAIGGSTFESPGQFRTLKEAEQAAAKSALTSLPQDGFQVGEHGLYKNLLQEFTLREKMETPVYKTEMSGTPQAPTFISRVEIGGEVFHGKRSKSKKESERHAAKVAYGVLKERKSGKTSVVDGNVGAVDLKTNINSDMTSSSEVKNEVKQKAAIKYEDDEVSESNAPACEAGKENSDLIMSADTKMSAENPTPLPAVPEVEKTDGTQAASSSKNIPLSPTGSPPRVPDIMKLSISELSNGITSAYNKMRYGNSTAIPEVPSNGIQAASPSDSIPISTNEIPDISTLTISDSNGNNKKGGMPYLLNNSARVYPYFPDNSFPEGITVMPISEDKWVAVSLEFPTEDVA